MRNFVRLLRFFCWSFVVGIAGGLLVATSFYLVLSPHLPEVEQLRTVQLQTPLRIYTRDQRLVAEFGEKRRSPINIQDAPKNLLNAFMAAEDSRFYEHGGVDIKGLVRASVQLVSTGSIQSGGSTITMQVAKNFFLSQERTFSRKFNEILLALKIEQELEKDEILELYLNKIYLGNRAYGVEAAANVYYGKSIRELTLAESAMIAGLPKAPSRYNPLASPDRALIRRNWILDRMLELNMISQNDHQFAKSTPITANYHGTQPEVEAPYIAEMARQEIVDSYGVDAYTDGLQVVLTIDSKLQNTADAALKKGILDYSRRHGYKGPVARPGEAALEDMETTLKQLEDLPSAKGLYPGVVSKIEDKSLFVTTKDNNIVEIQWEGLRWSNPFYDVNSQGQRPKNASEVAELGDIVYISLDDEGYKMAQMPDVQGALVSLTPEDGAILALVGGFDFYLSKFNRATQARRQPGSNFKPFVYLSALENGATASTIINDAPVVFEDSQLEASWRPQNSSGKFYGPTRLRRALYLSRNLVSIRLVQKIGINNIVNGVEQVGFDSRRIPKDLSIALGSAAFTPLEIASGYAALANGGHRVKPYLISKIIDHEGQVVFSADPEIACRDCMQTASASTTNQDEPTPLDDAATQQPKIAPLIADPRSVYILNSILQDVIRQGTGTKARVLGRNDLSGKTGTTNDQVDAWFSGYNGNIETTVWVGFDQPDTLGRREYGSRAALPIWIDYMRTALEDMPEAPMKQPPGIVTVKIDPDTGERATPGQENAIFEIFTEESAPTLKIVEDSTDEIPPQSDAPPPEIIF
ncbi:peptidase [Hahella sp. CCB-MM4]|uniref:penicillin-binding protein 1A n=1 Tax=Hahella sp. (strain CCB-MM4) TaxID=1926491 RepID=UPI000B9B290C|nr:penicillin-binding protein 1A [Hahella sp. CCB-MM4]OZG71433.1 peptidase [Hahella sp. CCB-MM4]